MATNLERLEAGRVKHAPGTAAGDSGLSTAVGELHKQHPDTYKEGLTKRPATHRMINKRPFSPGSGY